MQVTLRHAGQSEVSFACAANDTVLAAARRAGGHAARGEQGGCGACRARIVEGAVHYPVPASSRWLDEASAAKRHTLLCRAVPSRPLVVETAHPWRQQERTPLSRLMDK